MNLSTLSLLVIQQYIVQMKNEIPELSKLDSLKLHVNHINNIN